MRLLISLSVPVIITFSFLASVQAQPPPETAVSLACKPGPTSTNFPGSEFSPFQIDLIENISIWPSNPPTVAPLDITSTESGGQTSFTFSGRTPDGRQYEGALSTSDFKSAVGNISSNAMGFNPVAQQMNCTMAQASQQDYISRVFIKAACDGDQNMLLALLDTRSDMNPNAQDLLGITALECALQKNHPSIVKLLLGQTRYDLDPGVTDVYGKSALDYAGDNAQLLDSLSRLKKFNINEGLPEKPSPLMKIASSLDDPNMNQLFKSWLRRFPNFSAEGVGGVSLISSILNTRSSQMPLLDVLQALFQARPNLAISNEDAKILFPSLACRPDAANVMIFLLSKDPGLSSFLNLPNSYGSTPLDQMVACKNYEGVDFLIGKGITDANALPYEVVKACHDNDWATFNSTLKQYVAAGHSFGHKYDDFSDHPTLFQECWNATQPGSATRSQLFHLFTSDPKFMSPNQFSILMDDIKPDAPSDIPFANEFFSAEDLKYLFQNRPDLGWNGGPAVDVGIIKILTAIAAWPNSLGAQDYVKVIQDLGTPPVVPTKAPPPPDKSDYYSSDAFKAFLSSCTGIGQCEYNPPPEPAEDLDKEQDWRYRSALTAAAKSFAEIVGQEKNTFWTNTLSALFPNFVGTN